MQNQGLQVPAAALAHMRTHAQAASPEECCGLLVGHASALRVEAAWAFDNVAATPRRAFVMAPAALLDGALRARALGLEVLGVYHSHPHHDASPSALDAAHAVPSWFYLIMGCTGARAESTRVWRMPKLGGGFAEEAWVAV